MYCCCVKSTQADTGALGLVPTASKRGRAILWYPRIVSYAFKREKRKRKKEKQAVTIISYCYIQQQLHRCAVLLTCTAPYCASRGGTTASETCDDRVKGPRERLVPVVATINNRQSKRFCFCPRGWAVAALARLSAPPFPPPQRSNAQHYSSTTVVLQVQQ